MKLAETYYLTDLDIRFDKNTSGFGCCIDCGRVSERLNTERVLCVFCKSWRDRQRKLKNYYITYFINKLETMAEDLKKIKKKMGFACLTLEEVKKIASLGGRNAHKKGTAHEWNHDEAVAAGKRSKINKF